MKLILTCSLFSLYPISKSFPSHDITQLLQWDEFHHCPHLPSSLDAPTFGLTPQVNYELLVQTVTWLTRSGGTQAIGQWLDRFNGTPVSGGHSKTNQVHAMNNQQQQQGVDSSADGEAVLVFLPGMKEITTVQEMLIGSPAFRQSPQRDWVLPLHSVRRFLLSCVSFRFDSIRFDSVHRSGHSEGFYTYCPS